ncbi:calcium-binding protein [filamentous cyanobacterium LEGE 11480]|uniref:Calcium-binding protein n=1 Tax=Romeriopsis navalis LEGE 11480 TaxID=2777977 RepID=A0A928VR00_9CYAN|nr:calcium-binding protein [Romeriopsis navalis LEGE 11480]
MQLATGFRPVADGGNILADPRFENGDFTAPGYEIARIQVTAVADTADGANVVTIGAGTTLDIVNFTGVGQGITPTAATLETLDTIQFNGTGLTAENLVLTQVGNELKLSFEGNRDTQVVLQDFVLDQLDNIPTNGGVGNIIFDGESEIQDSFDVVNADDNRSRVFNRNTVTFLNDLDNDTRGFANSDDVINGQGGNDILRGLSGDDILRGGLGADVLRGGRGADVLIGGADDDVLYLGNDRAIDRVIYRAGDGSDIVRGFRAGAGGDQIAFEGIESIDVVANGRTTSFYLGDGIQGNNGFASGQLLVRAQGVSGLNIDNIGLNIGQSNTSGFLFA